MRSGAASAPAWARGILFWRKVVAVERRGIPGSRNQPAVCGQSG